MQLARDGRIILDLDDSTRANHISVEEDHPLPSWQQSPMRSYEQGKTDATSSKGEGAFTIQFGSLEPVTIPLTAQISTAETSLASDDGEGWTVVTRQSQGNQNKPRHLHSVVERDKVRRRILDIEGARRGRK